MMTFDVAIVALRSGQPDAALAALAGLSRDAHVEVTQRALDTLGDQPAGEAGPLLVALEPELMRAPRQLRRQACLDLHDELIAQTDRLLAEVRRRGWFTIADTLAGPVYLSYAARASGPWPGRTYELRRSGDHARLWVGQAPVMRLGLCCLLPGWATIAHLSGVDDDAAADLGLRVLSMELNHQFRLPPYTLTALTDGLAALPADEATVLRLHYGLVDGRPRPLSRIGKEIQHTLEMVRRWRVRGERRLAHVLRAAARPVEGDVCEMS
jgi:hypothetical protein